MRGTNQKGWWDSHATPCFLPTSLLGTRWDVKGDTDPNPNPGDHYRGLAPQSGTQHVSASQMLYQCIGPRVTSSPGPRRLLLLSFHSCAVW